MSVNGTPACCQCRGFFLRITLLDEGSTLLLLSKFLAKSDFIGRFHFFLQLCEHGDLLF